MYLSKVQMWLLKNLQLQCIGNTLPFVIFSFVWVKVCQILVNFKCNEPMRNLKCFSLFTHKLKSDFKKIKYV